MDSQRLKDLQMARKRFQQMNKTLETRISYLEAEDYKAQRIIEETKNQASCIQIAKNQQDIQQKNLEEVCIYFMFFWLFERIFNFEGISMFFQIYMFFQVIK